jgi:hypothetical protein
MTACPNCDSEMEKCGFCKKETYCLNCGCQSAQCLQIKTNRMAEMKSETITFRLNKRLLKNIDFYQKRNKLNRTDAIEQLIRIGLDNI